MKKNIFMLLAIFALSFGVSFTGAKAQGEAPLIVDTTLPVDAGIRSAVEAWLGSSAPVPLPYWAITSVNQKPDGEIVSIVALNIDTPEQEWHFFDTNDVAYMGSVLVDENLNVSKYSHDPDPGMSSAIIKLASLNVPRMIRNGAGGGSDVIFPWQQGSAMMYRPNGIQIYGNLGGAGIGFGAVDFIGGDDWGSGIAPAKVYAAYDGVIDYVCQGSVKVTIRTHDEATNSYYLYGNLIDNANLEENTAFRTGSLIGALKYGSGSDECSSIKQNDKHYHLHFGFIPLAPASSGMRIENCILNIGTSKWQCGTKTVYPGQFLVHVGGVTTGGQDDGIAITQPSFWDYVVVGIVDVWDETVIKNMPSHTTMKYTYVIYSSAKLAIKMARVLVYSNVNIGPLLTVALFGFSIKLLFGIAEFIVFLFKAWKSLVPILGA